MVLSVEVCAKLLLRETLGGTCVRMVSKLIHVMLQESLETLLKGGASSLADMMKSSFI